MNNHRLSAYISLLIISIIWGTAGPVIKFTLRYLPPEVFLTYRFAISLIIGIVFATAFRTPIPHKPYRLAGIIIAGFLSISVGLGLLFFGYEKTTALTGTLLSTVAPLFVVFLGAFYLHERVTKAEQTGIILAFIGTMIITVAPLLGGIINGAIGSVTGNMLIIASVLSDSVGSLFAKMLVRDRVSPETITHTAFAVGFATLLPLTMLRHTVWDLINMIVNAPIQAHLGVFYMAVLSGTLAYYLRDRAIKTVEISESAVFTYLYPLWAIPLSVFWLGERITGGYLIGGAIIAIGVFIAEYKRRRSPAHKKGRRALRHT